MAVLLIDLDETLVDRRAVVRNWAADLAAEHPDDPGLADWLVAWDSDGAAVRDRRQFLSGVRDRLGLTESVDELVQQWPTRFGARYRLDGATRAALQAARELGVAVVIVTNGTTARQEAKLTAMDVRGLVAGWVISEQVGVRKPDRRIFEIAAEVAGRPLDGSWMIGDDPDADVEGAVRAGLDSVWVNRHGRAWDRPSDPPPTFDDPAGAIVHVTGRIAGEDRRPGL